MLLKSSAEVHICCSRTISNTQRFYFQKTVQYKVKKSDNMGICCYNLFSVFFQYTTQIIPIYFDGGKWNDNHVILSQFFSSTTSFLSAVVFGLTVGWKSTTNKKCTSLWAKKGFNPLTQTKTPVDGKIGIGCLIIILSSMSYAPYCTKRLVYIKKKIYPNVDIQNL